MMNNETKVHYTRGSLDHDDATVIAIQAYEHGGAHSA